MQILLTLDKKDYEEGMPVFEKYSTRGVIIRDGKIATQHGSAGDYKILGGGVEPGEKLEDALIRETQPWSFRDREFVKMLVEKKILTT